MFFYAIINGFKLKNALIAAGNLLKELHLLLKIGANANAIGFYFPIIFIFKRN